MYDDAPDDKKYALEMTESMNKPLGYSLFKKRSTRRMLRSSLRLPRTEASKRCIFVKKNE